MIGRGTATFVSTFRLRTPLRAAWIIFSSVTLVAAAGVLARTIVLNAIRSLLLARLRADARGDGEALAAAAERPLHIIVHYQYAPRAEVDRRARHPRRRAI